LFHLAFSQGFFSGTGLYTIRPIKARGAFVEAGGVGDGGTGHGAILPRISRGAFVFATGIMISPMSGLVVLGLEAPFTLFVS
jgi:hypothetical protein